MQTILYIDDDVSRSEIMVERLTDIGYNVKFTSSADDAKRRIYSSEKFDAVILDLMMRRQSLEPAAGETQTGHILYRYLREQRPGIPIIVLTALSRSSEPPQMRSDKELKWFRKPVDADRIGQELETLLISA